MLFEPPINADDVISASRSPTVVDDSSIISDTWDSVLSRGPSLPIIDNSNIAANTPFISITNSRTVRLSGSLHNSHLLLDDHF